MSTVCKGLLLCILFCFALIPAWGQFVSNRNFSAINPSNPSVNNCATANVSFGTPPTGANPLQNMCANWRTATLGSPDFFYGCDIGLNGFDIPYNAFFSGPCEDPEFPSGGTDDMRAYAGIRIREDAFISTQYREYISQVLAQPLLIGRNYAISFWVRSSDVAPNSLLKQFGCLLTTTPANLLQNTDDILPKTLGDYGSAINPTGWDATAWQRVTMSIAITGTDKTFLTIGHFDENDWADGMSGIRDGYYFIDGVDIQEIIAPNPSICLCEASTPVDPRIQIALQPRANIGGRCCWDIVVMNYSDCDLTANGIALVGLPSSTTLSAPPGFVVAGNTITRPSGVFSAHTTTVMGTICMDQQNSTNPTPLPIMIQFKRPSPSGNVFCGNYPAQLLCANECCNKVRRAEIIKRTIGVEECCTDIAIDLEDTDCIRYIVTEELTANGWDNSTSNPAELTQTLSFCTPLGTTKQIRILFKNENSSGERIVVCIKEFIIGCADDCCSNIKNLGGYRVSSNPCCFRIQGTIESRLSSCMFGSFVISEQQGSNWNPLLTHSFTTVPDYFFSELVCLSSAVPAQQMLRIDFRDANGNILCTRFLTVSCSGDGGVIGVGKIGASDADDVRQLGLKAVPNPARDATTIHYTVHEQSEVRIQIYTVTGEFVAELQPGTMPVGEQHSTLSTTELLSGTYYVRVQIGSATATIPVTIVK